MKKIVSLVLTLAMLISLLVVPAHAASYGISLTADKTTVKKGDQVTFTVSIDKVDVAIGGLTLKLIYDSTKLEFVSKEDTGVFSASDLDFTLQDDDTSNWVNYAYTTAGEGQAIGAKSKLFTATFKVVAATSGSVAPTLECTDFFDAEMNDLVFTITPATVTIPQGVTGVSLDKTALNLAVNTSEKLTATVTPANATNKAVTWSSKDPSVATVSADGTVTAKKAGTTIITVTTADGGKTATCTVTVVNCKHEGTIKHVEAMAATCTATGNIEYWECADCHTKWSDAGKTTVVTDITIAKVPHNFTKEVKNSNTLKTAGNCMTEAVYYKSCSVCNAVSKTDTFKGDKDASKHTGKNTYKSNGDGTHSVVCECDVTIKSENCSGGTATCIKKAECTKCHAEYGDFAAHKFDTKWTVGESTHYHACTVAGCTAKDAEAAHGIGTKATCQHGNICDVCKRDDGAKAPHTAAASSAYVFDANNHWQLCQWCGVKISEAAHTWNTPATEDDAVYCTTCGYVKTAAKTPCEKHTPGGLVADEAYHYTFCTKCGEQVTKEGHTYGEATTVDGKKVEVCTKCGYVKTTATTPITPVNPGKPGKPSDKPVESQKTFDAGIALYAGMAVLSLTGGAWMIGKKKKEH